MRDGHLLYGSANSVQACFTTDWDDYGDLNQVEKQDEDLRGRCLKCGHGLYISGSTVGGESIYICRHGCGALVQTLAPKFWKRVHGTPQQRLPAPRSSPQAWLPIRYGRCEPGTYRVLVLDPAFNTALVKTVEFTHPQYALENIDVYLDNWVEPKKRGDV